MNYLNAQHEGTAHKQILKFGGYNNANDSINRQT